LANCLSGEKVRDKGVNPARGPILSLSRHL
jgi:hypothetical protein